MQILKQTNLRAYAKAKEIGQDKLIELISEKGLTGRGGAHFPTAIKLKSAKNSNSDKKYIVCNADESEPGAFKDRFVIENNPENLIEGIMIAAFAIGSDHAFIYLRDDYYFLRKKIEKAIKKFKNDIGSFGLQIEIIKGAGAYVCGDETAIMNSIMGNRGEPQNKPPYPYESGIFGKPTLINNVETLANIPLAVYDEDWDKNLRLFSLSGNISKPGVYEMPLGSNLSSLIKLGMPKKPIKAVYFGCAGGCLPYSDVTLSYEKIADEGCMLGPCNIIAVDNSHDLVDVATNISKFFEYESCGKCTPCREGTMRMLELLEKISLGKAEKKDLLLLEGISELVTKTSFCGLGQCSGVHIMTALNHFRNEFEEKCR